MFLTAAVLAFAMQADASADEVEIGLSSGPCRISIDGKPVSFDDYRAQVRKWEKTLPEIRFQPDPATEFECVDRVLRVLLDAKVTRLGFVGNEVEQ